LSPSGPSLSGLAPFLAGARGRCPQCGQGPLFQGFLKLHDHCGVCGCSLGASDSGDGPAVFVIIIAGFLVVFAALYVEVAYQPPIWVHLVVWLPLTVFVCLGLLRPVKGLMVAAQVANHASEAGSDDL
jgi:uncharacterized protein (DUF983 family)